MTESTKASPAVTKAFVLTVAIATVLINASITLLASNKKESQMVEFVKQEVAKGKNFKVLDYEYLANALQGQLTTEQMVDYIDIYLQLAAKKNVIVLNSNSVVNMSPENMLTAVSYETLLTQAAKYGITATQSETVKLKKQDN